MARELGDPRNRLGPYICGCRTCFTDGWCRAETADGQKCSSLVAAGGEARKRGYCGSCYNLLRSPLEYMAADWPAAMAKIMADYDARRAEREARERGRARAQRQADRQRNTPPPR